MVVFGERKRKVHAIHFSVNNENLGTDFSVSQEMSQIDMILNGTSLPRPPPVGLKGIGVTITPLYLLGDVVSLVEDNDDDSDRDILLWAFGFIRV